MAISISTVTPLWTTWNERDWFCSWKVNIHVGIQKPRDNPDTIIRFRCSEVLAPHSCRPAICLILPQFYWKNLRPATRKNFSRKISESRTAMWAARPISELAVLGRAWMTSYRTRLQSLFWRTGSSRFSIISAYTGPGADEREAGWAGQALVHLTLVILIHGMISKSKFSLY